MKPPGKIRILFADDHLVVRIGLRSLLDAQADMTVVAEAANGQEAVALFFHHRPDILLLDLRMPGLSGVEVIRAIRAREMEARILVLTTYDGDENIYRAFQAGARAYLLKDCPREEFLEAIRAVHAGEFRIPPAVAAQLAHRLPMPDLSQRELQILELISGGKTNKEIASVLMITESTVKNHVNSLLAKLKVHDRTQAAMAALRHGIISLK